MKLLRGQGVARLVQQAASGLLVVVRILGCWFSVASHQASMKTPSEPAVSVEEILHKFQPAVRTDANQLVIEVVVGVMH